MIAYAAVAIAGLVLAVVFRRRMHVVAGLLFVLAVSAPYREFASDLGSAVGAPTVLILTAVLMLLILRHRDVTRFASANRLIMILLGLVIFWALALSYARAGSQSIALVVSQIVAPSALFLIVATEVHFRRESRGVLIQVVVLIGILEATLALAQAYLADPLLYEASLADVDWRPVGDGRALGTLDHPLTLSLLLAVALALSVRTRHRWIMLLQAVVITAGIVASQSRTGFVIACLLFVLILVGRAATVPGKIIAAASVAGVLLVLSTRSDVLNAVGARFGEDGGSAELRGVALQYFSENWVNYFIVGDGMGASYLVADRAGLSSSFENSFIMYCIDLGVIVTIVYFGIMVLVVLERALRSSERSLWLCGAVVVIVPQTFSALSTHTAAGVIVWFSLGLVYVSREARGSGDRQAVEENSLTNGWVRS